MTLTLTLAPNVKCNFTHPTAPPSGLRTLEHLNFDNLAIRSLPLDPEPSNYIRPGQ